MSRKKLRMQVFVYLTAVILLIGVLFSIALFFLEKRRNSLVIRKTDMYIHAIVTHRSEVLANEMYLDHKRAIGLVAQKIAVDPEILNIRVFLPDGLAYYTLKTTIDSENDGRLPHHILNPLADGKPFMIHDARTGGHRTRIYSYPLTVIDEIQGFIQIIYNMDAVASANRLTVLIFIIMVLSILSILMVILGHILSRYVIRPVELLSSTMHRISQGTLGEQVEIKTENEIGDLALIFNRMSRENEQMMTNLGTSNAQLNHLQNLLSNIINSMPSVIIGVDTDLRVTQWNRTAEALTQVTASDAKGKILTAVYPHVAQLKEKIEESINTEQIITEQKIARITGQRKLYEDIIIYPLTANGSAGAVIRIDDVTEKTRLEEMIIQSEKMLSIGGLAAGMAHEINNPVAGMIQNADVIFNRLHRSIDMPANQKAAQKAGISLTAVKQFMTDRGIPDLLEAIRQSGSRITNIVSNMLDFARKSNSVTSSYRLDMIVDKTLELAKTDFDMKKKYDFKQIRIERKYNPDLPAIPCEMSKIQQVIFNLLTNAGYALTEAQTREPCITIQTGLDAENQMACLVIGDNGPGMEASLCERIFEPFFTTKPEGIGTGLGLSVSYFIITETHGGTISVKSSPGKGTRFIIRLPLSGPAVKR